jgi:hypothetical protein
LRTEKAKVPGLRSTRTQQDVHYRVIYTSDIAQQQAESVISCRLFGRFRKLSTGKRQKDQRLLRQCHNSWGAQVAVFGPLSGI